MKRVFISVLVFFVALISYSQDVIVVEGARGSGKIPLNLSGFKAGGDSLSQTFVSVLKGDLARSGYFTLVASGGQVALSGNTAVGGGNLQADCLLYKVSSRQRLLGTRYGPVGSTEVRKLAHKVADDIVYAVTGKKGMASGRIAVVGTRTGRKELYVFDMDGSGMRQVTNDRSIVVGPNWMPNGASLVYSSYKLGYANLFVTGQAKPISHYGGLNAGGAVSPDGKSMALILSKDGNPELYRVDLKNWKLTRLTRTGSGNEASPCWSPDGKYIAFVSDTSGTPKIYVISRNGGAVTRLPSAGSECVAPDWGANGLITFCCRYGGRYQIAVVNPAGRSAPTVLATDWADWEDPCWAPDGRHIVCSRTSNYRSAIYLLDTLKDSPVALISGSGDWYSPACTR